MTYLKSDQAKIKPQKNLKNQAASFGSRGRRTPKKITERYLHNAGLYYLERFAASKKHFVTVMLRKVKRSCLHHKDQNYDDCKALVHKTADKFEKVGLLDDAIYTTGLVTSLRRRGFSRNAIVNKLRIKGISPDRTLETLKKLDEENCENLENAERYAALKLARKKKVGPYFQGEEENVKRSLGIFARAGFSYQLSKSILDMDIEDAEELFMSSQAGFF